MRHPSHPGEILLDESVVRRAVTNMLTAVRLGVSRPSSSELATVGYVLSHEFATPLRREPAGAAETTGWAHRPLSIIVHPRPPDCQAVGSLTSTAGLQPALCHDRSAPTSSLA
jgi:plasmid maintenance system antidote protein VapI